MRTKNIHLLLCFSLSFCLTLQAQQSPFYYNKGKKDQLEIDYTRISVVSEGELTSEKVKSKINNSDFVVNKRLKNVLKHDPTSKDKRVDQNQDKEIITSEIVFPEKKDSKQYNDFLRDLRKEKDVITTSPTYLYNNQPLGISDKFLVKIRKSSDVTILESFARKYAIQVLERNKYLPMWYTLSCTKECPFNAVEAANCFYESKLFESTEPDFIFKIDLHFVNPPNDTLFRDQWGLKNTGQYNGTPGIDINVEKAWTKTTGSPNIRVAVFDSGVEMDNPDLNNVDTENWYDVNYPNLTFHTYSYHGTCVAGIIGAQKDNVTGICGVCPGCTIVSISFDNSNTDASQLAEGFGWGIEKGVDVFNCCWGGGVLNDHEILDDAITSAFESGRNGKGCVVVFSVGNDTLTNEITYPANSNSKILTVGAINHCGKRKNYYTYNSNLYYTCDSMVGWKSHYGYSLDVVAPGVFISTIDANHYYEHSTNPDGFIDDGIYVNVGFNVPCPVYNTVPGITKSGLNDYSDFSFTRCFYGTSAACPFVSGIAALLLSKNPNLTYLEVNDAIEKSTTKLCGNFDTSFIERDNGEWNGETGYGLVNADSALQIACNKNFIGDVFSNDTTIYGGKIVLFGDVIESGAHVIIKADETSIVGEFMDEGILVKGEFETELGSTFEITSNK